MQYTLITFNLESPPRRKMFSDLKDLLATINLSITSSWFMLLEYYLQHFTMPTMHGVQLATDQERNEASWIGMTGGLVGACRW